MDTPVKERLIGAAILVGLIVILVPEMLSGPRDAERPLAGEDASVRTYTIDLSAPGRAAAAREPAAEAEKGSGLERQPEGQPEPQPERQPARPAPERAPVSDSPPAPIPPQPASQVSGWAVQAGSFANLDNAKRLSGDLQKQGHKAFIQTAREGAKTYYKVRIGPEASRSRADALAARLKREGRQVAVVSHP